MEKGPPGTSGTFSCQSWISLTRMVRRDGDRFRSQGAGDDLALRCGQRSSGILSTSAFIDLPPVDIAAVDVACSRCGLSPPALPLVSLGLFLLPFEAVLVAGHGRVLLRAWCRLDAGGGRRGSATFGWSAWSGRRFLGPFLYALVLVVLLHVVFMSCPSPVGCANSVLSGQFQELAMVGGIIIAGLLRIPLWVRWGGLVSSDCEA